MSPETFALLLLLIVAAALVARSREWRRMDMRRETAHGGAGGRS